MKFNLSAVNIISDDHKDAINHIAEIYGCGSNNLSVKLIDSNGWSKRSATPCCWVELPARTPNLFVLLKTTLTYTINHSVQVK